MTFSFSANCYVAVARFGSHKKMCNCPLKLGVHYKCSLQNSPHSSTSIVDHAASFQVLHTRYPQKQKQAKKEQIWLILCMCIGMLFTTVLDCSQLPCGSWDLLEECRLKQIATQACLFIACAQNSFLITWVCHCVVLHHLQRREPVHTIIARMV